MSSWRGRTRHGDDGSLELTRDCLGTVAREVLLGSQSRQREGVELRVALAARCDEWSLQR